MYTSSLLPLHEESIIAINAVRECPLCRKQSRKKRDEWFAKASAAYGHVPQSEYQSLLRVAEAEKLGADTLNERLEWNYDSSGNWQLIYSVFCHVCRFTFSHSAEVPNAVKD